MSFDELLYLRLDGAHASAEVGALRTVPEPLSASEESMQPQAV